MVKVTTVTAKVRTEMVKVMATALAPLLALLRVPDFRSWQLDTASIGSSDDGGASLIDIFFSLLPRFGPRIRFEIVLIRFMLVFGMNSSCCLLLGR
jgi:hypothetical protein